MVGVAVRTSLRKALAVTIAIALLAVGYTLHGATDSSTGPPVGKRVPIRELTSSDLLLIGAGADGIHLRYQGVSGAPSADHANDVPVSSFQFGVARAVSSPPEHLPGVPSISEITLTHQTDRFSTKLLDLALRGTSDGATHRPTATLYFTDNSGPGGTAFDFMTIEIQEALVSGFSMSSGGEPPSESISINFSNVLKITTHIPAGTTQTVTYNVATHS